jgi:flagellar basal body-associated protein FliL
MVGCLVAAECASESMSGRIIYILVVAGIVLFFAGAATYYRVQFDDARQSRSDASHKIFRALDKSCQEKYGESYSFSTNRCCDAALDICAPL